MNHDGLLAADARIRSHPDLAHTVNLLVAHHDEIVFERCYRGTGEGDIHSSHSVTKSFISTLVGMLVGDGLVSLDAPVADLVPAAAFDADPAKQAITVRHLLTMSSGLYGHGWWDIDELELRGVPVVEGALHAPLVSAPGWGFLYNNGAAHVLSAVIEAVTGERTAEVARTRLFGPLGITRWTWPTDPQGRHWGCGGLELAARDMLKLGLLYVHGGSIDGRRVLDESYAAAATSPQLVGGPPEFGSYGFLWWVDNDADPRRFFAGGYGGQYIVVVPDDDLVVVTMADVDAVRRPKGFLLRQLVTELVVPAFASPADPRRSAGDAGGWR